MEMMTLEAGAAALAAMVKGLGKRLDALNGQGGWTGTMGISAGGNVPDWMDSPYGAKRALMGAAGAGGIPWSAGRAREQEVAPGANRDSGIPWGVGRAREQEVAPSANRDSGIPWGAGQAQELPDSLPAREHPGQTGGDRVSHGEMDAESMGRLVADTVNREIGRLARARRYTG